MKALNIFLLIAINFMSSGCGESEKKMESTVLERCSSSKIIYGDKCTDIEKYAEGICAAEGGSLCKDIVKEKISILKKYAANSKIKSFHNKIQFNKSIKFSPLLAKNYKTQKKILCKQYDNGNITCARILNMIAFYSPDISLNILKDIKVMEEELDNVSAKDSTLVNCGRKQWSSVNLSGADGLSQKDGAIILEKCLSVTKDFYDNYSGGTPSLGGGFSGVSGIDTGIQVCGLDISSGTDMESFTKETIERAENMIDSCNTNPSLAGSLMEGDAGTNTVVDSDGTKRTTSADGKTQTTKTTNNDGSVTTQTTTLGENGTSTTTTTRTNAKSPVDGSTSSTSSTTYTDPNNPSNNHSSTTTRLDESDGSGNSSTRYYDSQGNEAGVKDSVWRRRNEITTDVWEVSIDEDGKISKKKYDFLNLKDIIPPPQQGCTDIELCNACNNLRELDPKLDAACKGGDMALCSAFGEAASCCGSDVKDDPRVVMPDPQGNFVCTGESTIDLVESRCKVECSVASRMDCTSRCTTDLIDNKLRFDPIDKICQYAISDACFSKDTGDHVGGIDGLGPHPLPVGNVRNILDGL